MTIIYRDAQGTWKPYVCKMSGRTQFDTHEAFYKSRDWVRNRWAEEAVVLDGSEIRWKWTWHPQQCEALLTEGEHL